MELSIIIVSWNVADLLTACLHSIYSNPHPAQTEVIIIDSASHDDIVERIRTSFPQVELLPQTENVGFTRGNNIGLARATGKFILLLNPDTEIVADALNGMITFLDAHPQIGIVGPHTLNSDGVTHQSTRRRFPTFMTALFESTWLQPFAPRALLDYFYVNDAPNDSRVEVDWVQGSALMTRREVFTRIGGLDEGFVMFSEELDWCKRARNHGWKVMYLGDQRIIHHGGKSTDQVVAKRHIYFQESKLRYFRKHHGGIIAHSLRLFLLASYSIQLALEAAKGVVGHKPVLRHERVRQYWLVLRSGLKVT